MPKVKRDVLRYIEESIKYERGNKTAAPPGGYARGLDKAEADLVYLAVRETLVALGLPVKPVGICVIRSRPSEHSLQPARLL